ncbi:STM4011 family radical SAM protein [Serratia fonticola]|uniref:STM4011 family radical SAM protein n=1 Tax=Serratia fonticola TaxID=47917 RepID=UPI001648316E|nr:STM4011 family radical SAM protein [Serratia fonticola]MBC3217763.1 radical SAM protein [Serratia fonticola]
MRSLSILFRGSLSSCNYGCVYCPFAKHVENTAERQRDNDSLRRFTQWAQEQRDLKLSLFFTPWGEALVRKPYQRALIELSHAEHVEKVVFQTNLSSRLDFLVQARTGRIALWVTYHPDEVALSDFIAQCNYLIDNQVRFSVGVVGRPSHFAAITALRAALSPEIYLWVNAYRNGSRLYPYTGDQRAFLSQVDPLFSLNARDYPSRGKACMTGESVISVDQDGAIRRCHFVGQIIGNIYQEDFLQTLISRLCPRSRCYCHIGYVHMPELELYQVFQDGILERIPGNH